MRLDTAGRANRGHAERQAQNTPIQGSAADVVSLAQLMTNTLDIGELREHGYYDEELASYGVKHLMQIHDELIYKVPKSNAKAAAARVKHIMENVRTPTYNNGDIRAMAAKRLKS